MVMSILARPGARRPALPVETILHILSHPSRWIQWHQTSLESPLSVTSWERSKLVLCSPPLTARLIRQLRTVVFTFLAKDQGWSSYNADHGSYRNSWTWFEAAVLEENETESPVEREQNGLEAGGEQRRDQDESNHELDPLPKTKRQHLQTNRHAGRLAEAYRCELEAGQGILRDLKEGDKIALLAFAMYPGWVNHVEKAGLEIWKVDDLREC